MPTQLWKGTKNLGDVVHHHGLTLEVHHCGSCGVIFAIDEAYLDARRDDHLGWLCPNGHSFSFVGPSEKEKLRKQLRKKEEELAAARQRITATRDLLAAEERSHAATRGHLTRQRKRAVAGVCPCCHRSFQNVLRHMETKHPEAIQEAKAA